MILLSSLVLRNTNNSNNITIMNSIELYYHCYWSSLLADSSDPINNDSTTMDKPFYSTNVIITAD